MARVFLFLNAQETVNPKDIMTDAFHNFHPQYQSYTQYSASKLIARKIYKYIFSSYNKFLLLGGSGTRSGAGGRTSRGGTFDADDSSSSNHHQQHRITPTLHQPPGQSTTSASNSIPLTVTSPVVSGVSTAPRSPRTNTTATATGQTSSSTSSTAPAAAVRLLPVCRFLPVRCYLRVLLIRRKRCFSAPTMSSSERIFYPR